MLNTRETVAAAALALTPEDRELLVDELLRSLEEGGDREEAWLDEVERRLEAHDRGEGALHDGDAIIEKLERGECP